MQRAIHNTEYSLMHSNTTYNLIPSPQSGSETCPIFSKKNKGHRTLTRLIKKKKKKGQIVQSEMRRQRDGSAV